MLFGNLLGLLTQKLGIRRFKNSSMNKKSDEAEILKRHFWNKIKPTERKKEKTVQGCSIYISPDNLNPPQDRGTDGWLLVGKENTLNIDFFNDSFEFSIKKYNDLINEFIIIKHCAVLLACSSALEGITKFHLFNNNNEFYLIGNTVYFKGYNLKIDGSNPFYQNIKSSPTTFLLTTWFSKYGT